MNTTTFLQAAVPVVVGFALHKLIALSKRDKGSHNTPGKFKLRFWIADNWVSIAFHSILMLVIILYTPDIINSVTGYKHTPQQVSDIITAIEGRVTYLVLGFLSAMPMTFFEKKLRQGKKKIGILK